MGNKSKRQAGNEYQRWVKAWLEEKGWIVHNFAVTYRPMKIKGRTINVPHKNDPMGCDIYARKDAHSLWIQATLDSSIRRKSDELAKYFTDLAPSESVMIFQKVKGSEHRVLVWFPKSDGKDVDQCVEIGKIIRRNFYRAKGVIFEF